MKKILIIAAIALTTLNACKKETAFSEESRQSNTVANAQNAAVIIDTHTDFPGPYDLVNQCTGETVTVTGTIGDDMHIVINGNTMNFSEHQQGRLEGTGSLGNVYITTLNENVTLNGLTANNGVFVIDDVTIFRMISKRGDTNFKVRRVAHLTVNSNGTVTVDRIDFDVICS